MTKTRNEDAFDCAILGDTQTYSNREIGYLRDGVVEDLAAGKGPYGAELKSLLDRMIVFGGNAGFVMSRKGLLAMTPITVRP